MLLQLETKRCSILW